jgi:excisionase family DNA binding protein
MAQRSTVPQQVIAAATGLLSPYYPELSPSVLISALETPAKQPAKRRLSPRAYADMMGISRDTVMRLIHAGELESMRIGRQYRIIV